MVQIQGSEIYSIRQRLDLVIKDMLKVQNVTDFRALLALLSSTEMALDVELATR